MQLVIMQFVLSNVSPPILYSISGHMNTYGPSYPKVVPKKEHHCLVSEDLLPDTTCIHMNVFRHVISPGGNMAPGKILNLGVDIGYRGIYMYCK